MALFFASFLTLSTIITATKSSRPIDQIEHVIIFMQENRPFDHYFGTMKGVRGFNDRTPPMLSNGKNSFFQPVDKSDKSKYMLPFRTETNISNAMCMPAPEMFYTTDILMWNEGRMDAWNTARDPGYGMAFFTREELPYYYQLYDHFLVGDHYYQSSFTATNPNRMHLFSGSNGLSVGEKAVLNNDEPRPGYNWTTVGEVLEANNISWRVYQQLDNFDDNGFAWFANYQQARPGDALFEKGMRREYSVMDAFNADLQANTLPAVSYIIAPTRKSEHATNHPCAGEDFTARLLNILKKYPETYAKSLFILNYDEGGQFYDHAWTPTPPLSTTEGFSSVTVEGEINRDVLLPEGVTQAPIGLGFRVPLLLISPWTRGNLVYSEVLDHTSILQFLEERFNIEIPTISSWRRLITGNLLAAFDFDHPDYTWPENLPDTSKYVIEGDIECWTLPDPVIPAIQSMPKQEEGTRISRALPYQFLVKDAVINAQSLSLSIMNTGSTGAHFILYDLLHLSTMKPKQYSIAPDSVVGFTDTLSITEESGEYAYALHGPNGFFREIRGNVFDKVMQGVLASLSYDTVNERVQVELVNNNQCQGETEQTGEVTFHLVDNAYGLFPVQEMTLPCGGMKQIYSFSSVASGHWYDVTITLSNNSSSSFRRRCMGRMETGKDTISDPAMGAGVAGWIDLSDVKEHPLLDEKVRTLKRVQSIAAREDKDARFYLLPLKGEEL